MADRESSSSHYIFFGPVSRVGEDEYCSLMEQLVLYYDRRGRFYKRVYLSLSIIKTALVSLIPVLALSDSRILNPYMLAVMSAAALIADGIVNFMSCRDKWKSYRRTCDRLCMEHRLYSAKSGAYREDGMGMKEFVARCEAIINSEGEKWETYIDRLETYGGKHS